MDESDVICEPQHLIVVEPNELWDDSTSSGVAPVIS